MPPHAGHDHYFFSSGSTPRHLQDIRRDMLLRTATNLPARLRRSRYACRVAPNPSRKSNLKFLEMYIPADDIARYCIYLSKSFQSSAQQKPTSLSSTEVLCIQQHLETKFTVFVTPPRRAAPGLRGFQNVACAPRSFVPCLRATACELAS